VRTYSLQIDGEHVPAADGGTFTSYEPATGRPLAEVALGGPADVERAVAAARAAFDAGPWPRMSGAERAGLLRAVAARLTAEGELFAELETRDGGSTIRKSRRADLPSAVAAFERAAHWAETLVDTPSGPRGEYLRYAPLGVIGLIIPWNFPLTLAAERIAPAIAAGNACVVKPASFTSLTALELGRVITEAGLPPGVVNVVSGSGGSAGQALVRDQRVDLTSFTGSDQVGGAVAADAPGRNLRLELGGKSANVLLRDADLEAAAAGVAWSIFFHNGQICMAGSRAVVHRDRYDDFLALIAAQAGRLRLGDPLDPETDLGPLISRHQVRTVHQLVRAGVSEGARLVCGGDRPGADDLPEGLDRQAYYRPTVLAGVDNAATVARQEIFGPVLAVIPADSDEQALRIADDSPFALAAAVWSADEERARRAAGRLRAERIWINDYRMVDPGGAATGPADPCWEWLTNGLNDYRTVRRIHPPVAGATRDGLLGPGR
jgi:aldehyde dehydrogenase (NAD+)